MKRAALVLLALAPRAALAGGGPASDAYDGISAERWLALHAMIDGYVSHNFNNPPSGRNQLRAFDLKSDAPSIEYLRLTLAHKPRRFGFRIDAGLGDIADVYLDNDPAATAHPRLARTFSFIEQAFISMVLPVGRGIAVDAGKFSTPVGLEDNETLTNWNYSRALTYTWAEPSLHTGLRVTYEPTARGALSLYWLNGWNSNFHGGNELRSLAVAALWRPRPSIDLVLVYAGGLEHPPMQLTDRRLSFRNLLNCYVTYRPHKALLLALSGDYGNDRAQGGVNWGGVAAYARGEATRWLAAAARGELYHDPDGYTTGTRQLLGEVTLTVDVRGPAGATTLLTRLEYRHDGSTARVFEASMLRRKQDTITLGVVSWF